jgi:hypothetical protein
MHSRMTSRRRAYRWTDMLWSKAAGLEPDEVSINAIVSSDC